MNPPWDQDSEEEKQKLLEEQDKLDEELADLKNEDLRQLQVDVT